MASSSDDILARKQDHLDVVLQQDVGFGQLTTGFEHIRFVHNALPELNLEDIDLSASLFGTKLKAPILMSSMTGGPVHAAKINRHLAEAAQELGIAFAVGSQRVALEGKGEFGIDVNIRQYASNSVILGNIGGAQISQTSGVEMAKRAIEMIEANGIYVHLNPLQEAVQSGGNTDWRGVLHGIELLCKEGLNVAVKEVGFGLSTDVIRRLVSSGVSVIDVAGAGGTNWARVEGYRDPRTDKIAKAFTDWGIPTAAAVKAARNIAPEATIIASGGIRNGIDIAKAIRLGADIGAQAAATLKAATESTDAVVAHFQEIIDVLKLTLFVTGSADLTALKSAQVENGGLTHP